MRKYVTSMDMYDRNAITWDDDRKMAAFVTPADNVVRSYASKIRQFHKEIVIPALNDEVQFAIQAYNVLGGTLFRFWILAPSATLRTSFGFWITI